MIMTVYFEQVAESDGEKTKITHCKICCCHYKRSKPLIMIIAAGSLIVFRIWATFLDFYVITKRSDFHCTWSNDIILYFAVSQLINCVCHHNNLIIIIAYNIIITVPPSLPQGFGNSCQGLVNFIIFYGFTGQCCKVVYPLCSNCCKKQRPPGTVTI